MTNAERADWEDRLEPLTEQEQPSAERASLSDGFTEAFRAARAQGYENMCLRCYRGFDGAACPRCSRESTSRPPSAEREADEVLGEMQRMADRLAGVAAGTDPPQVMDQYSAILFRGWFARAREELFTEKEVREMLIKAVDLADADADAVRPNYSIADAILREYKERRG